jgi:hypothetical protein
LWAKDWSSAAELLQMGGSSLLFCHQWRVVGCCQARAKAWLEIWFQPAWDTLGMIGWVGPYSAIGSGPVALHQGIRMKRD